MKWRVLAWVLALALALVVAPLAQAQEPRALSEDAPRGGVFLVGRLLSVAEDALSIEAGDQEWAVTVTEETIIRLPGIEEPTLADLKVGKVLSVRGKVLGVGQMEAEVIAPPQRAPRPGNLLEQLKRARQLVGTIRGEISALADEGFTVTNPRGALEVVVNEETRYRIPGVEEPSFADLAVGQLIVVRPVPEEGGLNPEDGVTAAVVGVVSEEQMRRIQRGLNLLERLRRLIGGMELRGEVKAILENGEGLYTLAVDTPRGEVTVQATGETKVWIGRQEASIADVKVGDRVLISGRPDLSCPIHAWRIGVLPEGE
ncbi:MAG: hypothetical protein H5T69_16575, partial [Chloroflexi bacterium]|nr:hypothetical protein [Chloroflexota bacterium]